MERPKSPVLEALRSRWAFLIWIVIFSAAVVVGLFGEKLHLPLEVATGNFWHYWELAAFVSTCLFNVLFYFLGFFLPPRMFLRLRDNGAGSITGTMFLAVGALLYATYISLRNGDCLSQLSCLLAAAIFLFMFDFIMAEKSRDVRVQEDFWDNILTNDFPSCIALLALLILCAIRYHRGQRYDETFRAFIGGAIAFQMLVSNWVIALIFYKPGKWYQGQAMNAPDSTEAVS